MKVITYLLRSINLINLALAALFAVLLNYTILPFFHMNVIYTPPGGARKAIAETKPASETPAEIKNPFPSDFSVIAEKNLFHFERKVPVPPPPPPPPLPVPNFILFGTLKTDELQIAYMIDKKAPVNTKPQVPVKLGDSLSGFILKIINPDSVVMERGEEKITVLLHPAGKARSLDTAAQADPQSGVPAQPQIANPVQTTGQTASQVSRRVRRPAATNTSPPNAQGNPMNPIMEFFGQKQKQ